VCQLGPGAIGSGEGIQKQYNTGGLVMGLTGEPRTVHAMGDVGVQTSPISGSQGCPHLGENIRTEDGMLLPQVVAKYKEM